MTNENNLEVGTMRIELFLPGEQVPSDAKIIPVLPHGANIATLVSGNESLHDCDALSTANRTLSLGIRTADCAPICFSDGKKIGIAHVGWRGLCQGLVEKMLPLFNTATVAVYVAPFLDTFEIQKDFCYDQITEKFGERFIEQKDGKLFFNFKEAIDSLLPPQAVYDSRSTGTVLSLPSYRRRTNSHLVTVVSFRMI